MKTDTEIDTLFTVLRAGREAAIETLRSIMEQESGEKIDRSLAAIKYDTDCAPCTNNRSMLLMVGIDADTADLETIVAGMAKWGIFFVDTDHLTDAEFKRHLKPILADPIPFVPPNSDMSEYISLASSKGTRSPKAPPRDLPNSFPKPKPSPEDLDNLDELLSALGIKVEADPSNN